MATLDASMRTKLTALIVACAALAAGAVAHAAPIPVATYTFQTMDDVNAFQKVFGDSCKRKWQGNQALLLGVGNNTNACIFRSSVVADSSQTLPDQGMVATTSGVGAGTPKLQKQAFVGVGVRYSSDAGYILRVLPEAHKWQYLRDPMGTAGPKVEASGSGNFIKVGNKPNVITIRAFSFGGTTTSVVGTVNGNSVVNNTDSGTDQPNGRQTVLTVGSKGSGAGTGINGIFDNVTVQVPNPF
jgi:hypothetical protein